MNTIEIKGKCSTINFYEVLNCIDALKISGWFIEWRSRNVNSETGETEYNYHLKKH